MFEHSLHRSRRNSPQQESANPFSFGQETFSGGQRHRRQRDAGFEAAQAVAHMNIRRGDRRGSIIDTNFISFIRGRLDKSFLPQIRQVFEDTLVYAEQDNTVNPAWGEAIRNTVRTDTAFSAYLTKITKYGNCAEFANLVFTFIMQETIGQPVYKVEMVGRNRQGKEFDHAIVITTSSEVSQVSNTKDFDPQDAVVIDAWYNNKVQTLGKFYAGDNPYKKVIEPHNIKIVESDVSNGSKLYMTSSQQEYTENSVKAYMSDAATLILSSHKEMFQQQLERLRDNGVDSLEGIFDFPRDNEVHDTRNTATTREAG